MNIGDYVRTKRGILKIRDDRPFKDDKNKLNYLTYGNYTCVLKENIIKSSPNIIDLIEEGDYVNGYKVIDIVKGFKAIIDKLELDTTTGLYHNIGITNIKSIVTKEQFNSMEYKIGDDKLR